MLKRIPFVVDEVEYQELVVLHNSINVDSYTVGYTYVLTNTFHLKWSEELPYTFSVYDHDTFVILKYYFMF